MAHVCAIRQFPFDTHLGREVDALVAAGHAVEVVCMRRPGEPWRERRGRLTLWRVPLEHRRGGAGRYVFEHAAFLALATAVVAGRHLRRPFDLVQVNSPPDSVVLAASVPRLLGVPVLLDLVEATPEFFATRFQTTPRHPLVRLLEAVEQLAIRFAHAAITGTEQMRRRFMSRGADGEAITVVLNASDEAVFDRRRVEPVPQQDGFVLISHGTIERRYGLDTVIRAVASLRERLPDLRLEIYGDGTDRDELVRLAAELGAAERIHFSDGFVPIDDLVRAIAAADAGVVAVKRDPFRDLTHTNKMFDFVAMGCPAIVSWTQSVADYFDEEAFAFFRADDPEDLARAIVEVHDDPARRERMVRRASELHARYRGTRQREIYLGVVQRLLDAARR
ncbi:MAG TPA: glycosyltransferase [Solirubrobacteraceae bacterium]|nr:glycosyltransferase [Solirubrobacteraceae bacterium]